MHSLITPAELVRIHVGHYTTAPGIKHKRTFQVILCCDAVWRAHFGTARLRTWRKFAARSEFTPQRMLDSGWDELVIILDACSYTLRLQDCNQTACRMQRIAERTARHLG